MDDFEPDLIAVLDQAYEDFGPVITTKLQKAFRENGVRTLADITLHPARDFELLPLFGPKGLGALREIMQKHDISFQHMPVRPRLALFADEAEDLRVRLLLRLSANARRDRGMCMSPKEVFVLAALLETAIEDITVPH